MAEASNEPILGVLRAVRTRLAGVDGKIDELKHEMQAFRTHMIGVQQEMSGIHATLVGHERRRDRIVRRPELTDAPSL
jgi:hypothetical protein